MDENDVRSPRDRVDDELLHRLLGEEHVGRSGHSHDGVTMPYRSNVLRETRGCDGSVRRTRGCDGNIRENERNMCGGVGDYRCGIETRNEQVSVGGCGCDEGHHHHHAGDKDREDSCPCGENGIEGHSLAMVYSPVQHWREMYDPHKALSRGTQFRELDLPFHGNKHSDRGGNCRGY